MNEAEFEARVNSVLNNIFPNHLNMEIKHQLSFSVRMGHNEINLKSNLKSSRLDILIKYKDLNLAVMELKRPNISLSDDDRVQGLSYARLLEQMPPLVIVSNGLQTRLYDSYTGNSTDLDNPDASQLERIFSRTLEVAASEKDSAIRTLLGKNPDIWEAVIQDLNRTSLESQIGSIIDYSYPIAENFQFPRQSAGRIAKLVSNNNSVVAVIGAPMVGKTNVLYQVCRLDNIPFTPIYVNAADCQYGIFQYLANYFTKHFFSAASKDDIRQWLQHSIIKNQHPAGKIVFIIDGVSYSNRDLIREIEELIELCSMGASCSLIIACDSSNYDEIAYRPGRADVKTLIGKKAFKVEIDTLNDSEFKQVEQYLLDHYTASFQNGAIYSRELRNPRLLRMIVAQLPEEREENQRRVFPSFLPYRSLNKILNGYELRFVSDMVKLVQATMEQDLDSPNRAIETMATYGRGYTNYEKAEKRLGEGGIERLRELGHINWFTDKQGNRYVAPKVPELLASAAADVLFKDSRGMEFDQAADYILAKSEKLPYGDLIAANVFERLNGESGNKYSLVRVLVRLINRPPRIENVTTDFKGSVYFDDTGLLEVPQELLTTAVDEDSKMFSNLFPWLVLSQLATEPMMLEVSEDPWSIYRQLLIIVGGYPNVLRRFDPTNNPDEIVGYNMHSMKAKDGREGEVLCGLVGIIEPITYAMQCGFYRLPDQMVLLCKHAVHEDDPFLRHRLHNAATSMVTITKEDSALAATKVLRMLSIDSSCDT